MSNIFCLTACGYRPDHAMLNISVDVMSGAELNARNKRFSQFPQGVLVMRYPIAHGFCVLVSMLLLASSSSALSPDGELHERFSHMRWGFLISSNQVFERLISNACPIETFVARHWRSNFQWTKMFMEFYCHDFE